MSVNAALALTRCERLIRTHRYARGFRPDNCCMLRSSWPCSSDSRLNVAPGTTTIVEIEPSWPAGGGRGEAKGDRRGGSASELGRRALSKQDGVRTHRA